MEAEQAIKLLHRLAEQRWTTLALVEQIGEDRWREPALPGNVTTHDLLAHLLAWDEWAVGVFEISLIRDLPPALQGAFDDIDGFNARAQARYRGINRDDMFNALQSANQRLLSSAQANGGPTWYSRNIVGLRYPADWQMSQEPDVGGILRVLRKHESGHSDDLMATFGIVPPARDEDANQ